MARNYVNNSSFELALTDTWQASGVGTLDRAQTKPRVEGNWYGRLTATGSGNPSLETAPAAYIPTDEGDEWTVSVYVQWGNGTPKPVHVDLRWRDAAGATVGSAAVGDNLTPGNTSWLRITNNDNTVPAGAVAYSIRVVGVGLVSGDELLVDLFMGERGNLQQPSPWTAGPDEIRTPILATAPRYPLVQFVREPEADPTVLFDCNTFDGIYVTDPDFEDFTLGAPDAEREPEQVNLDDGYRSVGFTVCVATGYTDAAAHISALSQVLQREKGWLLVQRDALHQPMFLRWYRSDDQPVSWGDAKADVYTLPIELDCDPFVRGEPVILTGQHIVNNPADVGSLPASYELPPIKGDAPAPLQVKIIPDGTLGPDWTGFQPFMATTAYDGGTPWDGPIFWDLVAADFTAGTGVGGDVADANYVGGSYRLFTPTGSTMAPRLTGEPPTAPIPGLYKVLLRCTLTAQQATVFNVRLGQTYDLTQVRYGQTKTIDRSNRAVTDPYTCWVDLGEFMFPFGAQNIELEDLDSASASEVVLDAQRAAGTGNLRLDCLLLIPIKTAATVFDSRTQTSKFHGFGIENLRSGVWDGEKERFGSYNFDISLANLRQPDLRGGWMRVVPGANNVFHLLQQTATDQPFFTSATYDDDLGNVAEVRLSYLPRYLHLRPDTE